MRNQNNPSSRIHAEGLDRADPLARYRAQFELPSDVIYLNGHSLGPLPKASLARLTDVAAREWARDLTASWNTAGWFALPKRLGDKIAPIIGAPAGSVVVSDGVVTNLFKAVAAALALRPERRVIVMEGSNFPTDNYVVQGLTAWLGHGHTIRFVESDGLLAAIDPQVAATVLTHVHYKTSAILDMAAITARAHHVGALAVWDLSHSIGAVPVDVGTAKADFAVGCTYKYLNGGPGSPAFIYVAPTHQAAAHQPITGWWAHKAPFAFDRDYAPAEGTSKMLTGSQPILSMAAIEPGLDMVANILPENLHRKCGTLGETFLAALDPVLDGFGLAVASPRDPAKRGGHVALDHAEGARIVWALAARGVMADFRAPTTMRFGFSPLFLRHVDAWDAAAALIEVLKTRAWDRPEFALSATVT